MTASGIERAVRALALRRHRGRPRRLRRAAAATTRRRPAQTLGPAAGSVTSSDGKVTVSVGDNALQAATTIAIAAAEPDAATAADPSLVPGTTYEYTAPRLQVPEQVLIRIDSPHAVAAAAAAMPGRARILALPPGYFPPPTCLVNSTVLEAPVQNIWVDGDQCPQAPAPACLKIVTVEGENLNPLDGIPASKTSLCAPAADLVAVPGDQICPSGYREVTGEPAFADFAAQHSLSKICERLTVSTGPVLGVHGKPSSVPCTPRDGHFLCVAGQLPTGRLSVMWDRTPPNEPLIGFFTPSSLPASLGVPLRVVVPEDGSPTTMTFTIKATDPDGLGGVELVEASGAAPLPSTYGAGVGLLPGHTVWSAPAAAFSGAPLKSYESGPIEVPYSLADPASRLFFFRVFDRAGNSRLSLKLALPRETDGITIDSFGLGSEIILGALVQGLKFKVKGAAATSIDHGVGSIPVIDTLEFWSERFLPASPVPGLTYTLTATHPTRATKTATFTYGVDTTAPTVQLFGAPTGLIAPGDDDADRHGERRRRHRQGRVLSRRDADRHRHRGAVFAGREPERRRCRNDRLHRQGLRRRGQRHDEQRRQRRGGHCRRHAAGRQPGRQPGHAGRARDGHAAGQRQRRRRHRPGRVLSRRDLARHPHRGAVPDDGRR